MRGEIVLQERKLTYEALQKCVNSLKCRFRNTLQKNQSFGLCIEDNFIYLLYFILLISENKKIYLLHPRVAKNTLDKISEEVVIIGDQEQQDYDKIKFVKAISRTEVFKLMDYDEKIIENNTSDNLHKILENSLSKLVFATSGTSTGVSKFVEIDFAWIQIKSIAIAKRFEIKETQSCVIFSSMCFIQVIWTVLSHLYMGAVLYFTEFRIEAIVDLIKQKEIYTIVTTASIIRGIITCLQKEKKDLNSIRRIICGGDYVSYSLLTMLKLYFPLAEYGNIYGCTELSAASTVAGPYHLADVTSDVGIGEPFLDSEIWLSEGNFGEIYCKTRYTSKRYYGETQMFIDKEGFFATGDWARRDNNGTLYYISRENSIINYNGQKINPFEIEEILNTYDEINECVVIKERKVDNEMAICYIKKYMPISKDLIIKKLSKYLESYKIPRHFYLVETLPKTVSGKIIRDNLAYFNIKKVELV